MGIRENILFGEIALQMGVLTPEQLNDCIDIQEKEKFPRQLGIILIEKGYLDSSTVEKILEEQQKNLLKHMDNTQKKQRSLLFGQMAISRGFITQGQLNESIREQAKIERMGIFMHLGEIFVKKGFMSEEQTHQILKEQKNILAEINDSKKSSEES